MFNLGLGSCLQSFNVKLLSGRKRKLGSNTFIATQPGIIATIYLSPIALLKNKTPYKVLSWPLAIGLYVGGLDITYAE